MGKREKTRARRASATQRYAALWAIFNRVGAAALLLAALAALAPGDSRAAGPVRILMLGDSLTSGYGLPAGDGLTARLEAKLRADGHDVTVINGGVSGDTSAGGRARLDWALADRPDIVVVALGGNDALRGIDPASTKANLDAILARLRQAGAAVLLAGMYAPPNFGRDYERRFRALYPALAAKHGVALFPFLLDGVAGKPELNQADGIHPSARGVRVIVDRIAPSVVRLLDTLKRG